MQVLFDLRPRNLIQLQSDKLDLSRVLALILFTALICLSLANIGYTGVKLKELRDEIADLRVKDAQIVARSKSIEERLNGMREMEERITAYIAFTRQELPVIEFLSALESCVVPGLKVTQLEIRQSSVSMQGLAVDGKSILDFSAQLNERKGVVMNVNAPITTATTLGSRMINDFRVSCRIKGIADITDITGIVPGPPSRQEPIPQVQTTPVSPRRGAPAPKAKARLNVKAKPKTEKAPSSRQNRRNQPPALKPDRGAQTNYMPIPDQAPAQQAAPIPRDIPVPAPRTEPSPRDIPAPSAAPQPPVAPNEEPAPQTAPDPAPAPPAPQVDPAPAPSDSRTSKQNTPVSQPNDYTQMFPPVEKAE